MALIIFLSNCLVPLIIFYITGFGILSKRPVFDDFLKGARDGLKTVVKILPTLIGLMTATGVLRASGFLDFLSGLLKTPASVLHLPSPLVPVLIVRLISNSAAIGLVLDIFKEYGTDSSVGMMASVLMSCTETVFYCISIYFGTVKITKTRYTLAGALAATAAGVIASILLTS
ncbi:nucleoside recognition domain-containing protein [Clostridium sp. AM58-1XD]|uniref:nucleoside recognition domain-containing protein n=1 Tax=Clostridium sp. AM58-1XD TaxID=2292307 RepID=UPI000E4DFF92|nr:nucleoside recognition domain-containing protein [Clostridium sp. AM58-1XD]RGZ01190.1 spore maturation protein [Clostridium sp. AM58-1XD]